MQSNPVFNNYFISMTCVLPPNYVREVTFVNESSNQVTVSVNFKSGANQEYVLGPGESKVASRDIQHDTWTSVDAVTEFTCVWAVGGPVVNENLDQTASGVEVRTYLLKEGNEVARQ